MTRTARFWAVLALAACGVRADAGAWRAVALDPTHVVLQGDYSAEEHAAFALTEEEKKRLFCIMGHGRRNGKRRSSQLSAA